MKKFIYLALITYLFLFSSTSLIFAQSSPDYIHDGMNMKSRVSAGPIPISIADLTKNQEYTGNVSIPIPLVSLGGVDIQLKYNSENASNKVRTENRYAPSGEVGFGWQLIYGFISADINNTSDTSDDKYYYNGPDGSFQLQEGADGVFRIPNYKPWRIQRVMVGDKIGGWIITKEDGTALRFGNYYRTDTSYNFSLTDDSTYATRFLLGYKGVVSNVAPALYDSLSYIPYQWDLSSVQDVSGDSTRIIYQPVLKSLSFDSYSTGSMKYTSESYPYKIIDEKGGEIDFVLGTMNSDEYYNFSQTYEQNLFGTKYLDTVYIKGNNTTFKKIVFTYSSSDFLGIGVTKKYLTGITFEDAEGNSLPSYQFEYYQSSSDINPGGLKSLTDPNGGNVSYTYRSQSLTNVGLDTAVQVPYVDYYNAAETKYNDDGLAGKDFVIVKGEDYGLTVYRRGAQHWYLDTSFPFLDSVWNCKVASDYVVLTHDSSLYVVRRTPGGWKYFNVDSTLQAYGIVESLEQSWVVGVGTNYFVIKYNPLQSGMSWETAILMFTSNKLIVKQISGGDNGRFYEDTTIDTRANPTHASMRAFCGQNYMVLASAAQSDGYGTLLSHFRYSASTGQWQNIGEISGGSSSNPFDLLRDQPDRVYIGKNFVVDAISNADNTGAIYNTQIEVFKRDSSVTGLDLVDNVYVPNGIGDLVVADNYYAYSIYEAFEADWLPRQISIRDWNGKNFTQVHRDFPQLYGTNNSQVYVGLTAMDNRLVVNWEHINPVSGYNLEVGYTTFSPSADTGSWSELNIINDEYNPVAYPKSSGIALNQNTYIEVCYAAQAKVVVIPNLVLIHAYQFHGGSVSQTTVDSIWTEHTLPKDWVWQPGGDFFAFCTIAGKTYGYPDSLRIYSLNNVPDGSMEFDGNPRKAVVEQKTISPGIGTDIIHSYSFGNGVLNQYLTPEFGTVTDSLPNGDGKIQTRYYTYLDSTSTVNGINYRFLDGEDYDNLDYNSSGDAIQETKKNWTTVSVDPTNGVYFQKLQSESITKDGVIRSTSYGYDGAPYFQVRSISETNSDGKVRLTKMKYPQDYTDYPNSNDSFVKALSLMMNDKHIINAVIEKTIWNNSDLDIIASKLTKYKEFNNSQILPAEKWSLKASSPISYLDWQESNTTSTSLNIDASYSKQQSFNSYDTHGNLLQSTDANGYHTSYKYGYDDTRPVAVAKNASTSEISYDGFEDSTYGDWSVYNAGTISSVSHTGKFSYYMSSNRYRYLTKTFQAADINTSGTYRFSGWVKTPYGTNWASLICEVNYNSGSDVKVVLASAASGNTDWQYVSGTIDLSSYSNISYIRLYATNGSSSQYDDFYWDDLRFYPSDAEMTTMTYDPVTLELTSKSNTDNDPVYYTYDSFGRLNKTYNYDHEMLSRYLYHLAGDNIGSRGPNYITVFKYRDTADSMTSSQNYDGLRRPIQTLGKTSSSSHIVTDKVYDSMGRDSIDYKPFDNTGPYAYLYNSYVLSDAKNYYNSNVYDGFADNYPYAEHIYYNDPLGRVKEDIPPGSPWQTHPVKYYYGDNTSSEVSGYSAGTLYKTTTTDENGHKTIEFRDKFGYVVETKTDSGGLNLTTKFTHDLLGNLTKTIPPNSNVNPTTYSYNTLGQMTEKTSPDAGSVQHFYDKNGNLRLVVDANHLGSMNSVNVQAPNGVVFDPYSTSGQFTLGLPGSVNIKADPLDAYEATITVQLKKNGVVIASVTSNDMNIVSESIKLQAGTYNYKIFTANQGGGGAFNYLIKCTTGYEFIYHKYDALNRLVETGDYYSSTLINSSEEQSDANNTSFPTSNNLVSKKYFYDTPTTDILATGQRNLQGRLSYTESYNNSGSLVERTCYSYDDIGRVEWVVQSKLTSSGKKIVYTYDLQGNVTDVEYEDLDNNSPGDFYTNYTYDAAGRMTSVSTNNSIDGSKTMADYQYFASGKTKQLKTGVADVPATIKYRYNQRDWMIVDSTGKFWEHVGYNKIAEAGQPRNAVQQFNGNISWNSYYMYGVPYTDPIIGVTTNTIGYAYSYDNANRLTSAELSFAYGNNWSNGINAYNVTGISYYGNGSIKTLQRYGYSYTLADNLSYKYRPGTDIDTLITNSAGTGANYTYDAIGNVTSDSRDSIAFVIYNIDNLPVTEYKNNGTVINYSYDVDGNRIKKVVGSDYTYYVRGKDGETEAVIPGQTSTSEVYNILVNGGDNIAQQKWSYSSSTLSHFYYLKDHLGNIKMTLNSSGSVDSYNDYYPYGMQMPGRNSVGSADARYKFTSKELDAESNLYYFGARYYNSWSGQWGQVDPLSEETPDVSPYVYSLNNPVNFIDMTGMDPIDQESRDYSFFLAEYNGGGPHHKYIKMGPWPWGTVVVSGKRDWILPPVSGGDVLSSTRKAISKGLNWVENKTGVHLPDVVNNFLSTPIFGWEGGAAEGAGEAGAEAEEMIEGGEGAESSLAKPNFEDPSKSPGKGWEWKGRGKPGSPEGSWYNPKTGEVYRPDLNHPEPIKPHYDYRDPQGKWWRQYPDGTREPK